MLRVLLPLLLLAACGKDAEPPPEPGKKVEAQAPLSPPAPGEPGGLPDDGTPLTKESAKAGGAQKAATVLETYYALIGEGKYRDAWELRWSEPGDSPDAFVESFGRYATYRANVGAPSEPQAAGGSLYVEVPVQIYGRLKNGETFSSAGNVTLRRKGNEGRWRIQS